MRKLALLVMLLALLVSLSAYAQGVANLSEDPVEDPDPGGDQTRHPNVAKGIDPEKAVVGDLDSINLFNGNLTLTIPIGQRYPLSTRLGYQLVLSYNSTVWDFETVTRNNVDYTAAYPDRRANAGVGWSLSLGRLYAPDSITNETARFVYESADGSDHPFFESLHLGETIENGVGYTRDGSYLRLREVIVNGVTWQFVDLPDGTVQEFAPVGANEWQLRVIRDQFNSSRLDIAYVANATTSMVDWKLTDTEGRQHWVRFAPLLQDGANVPMVDKVELAGPNGVLTYDFTYEQESTARPCADTDDPALGGTSAEVTVHTLSQVQLPGGTAYSFGYNIIPVTGTTCFGAQGTFNGGRGFHDKSGMASSATLPTGGTIGWTYGQYILPSHGPAITDTSIQYTYGVHGRSVTDPVRGTTSTWSYTPLLDEDPGDVATSPPNMLINTVVDPAGNHTEHFFNVKRERTFLSGTEYGLPFSPINVDPVDGTRYLSRREYGGGATPVLIREHYVKYVHDQGKAYVADPKNRRLSESLSIHDVNDKSFNVPIHSKTTLEQFDGLGHFRLSKTDGNYARSNLAETFTNYNADRGTYFPGPSSTFTMIPSSAPWVLETFSEVKQTEVMPNGQSSVVRKQFCFDPATGALKRERTLAGTIPGTADLLDVYVLDGDGNPVRQDSYGGDGASLSTNEDLCALSLPSVPSFRTVSVYEHGVLKEKQNHHPTAGAPTSSSALPFKSVDVITDQNTGKLKVKSDTAGRSTVYSYDVFGRVSGVTPPSELKTTYTYANAAWSGGLFIPSSVTSTRGTLDRQVSSVRQFDGLGRLWREKTLMPDGTWSVSETQINSSGWVTAVSEREKLIVMPAQTEYEFVPSHLTLFSDFDPFGRSRTVEAPDGTKSYVSFIGIRQATRKRSVAMESGEASISTREDYDRQGRLYKVTENSTSTSPVVTTYEYDAASRLRKVTMAGRDKNGIPYTQPSRTFTYDGRGLLVSEWHPETNGISYTYDAAGNMTSRTDGERTLTYVYDHASRLVSVSGGSVVLKELSYDRENGTLATLDYSNGKLDYAIRHNRHPLLGGDVKVKETYVYTGRGGRLSRKETSISTGATTTETFTDSYSYDNMGALESVTMPKCTVGCGSLLQTERVVNNTYKHGMLAGVDGFADPIEYHPNGLLKSIRHLNEGGTAGPLYEQTIADGMARPREIKVTGTCTGLAFSQNPASGTIIVGQSFPLTVSAAGATSYTWFDGVGNNVGTGASINVNPLVTTTYWARATIGTCMIESTTAVVTVNQCPSPAPSISAVSTMAASATQSATVTTASGVAITSYQWFMDAGSDGEFTSATNGATVSFRAHCSGTVLLRVEVTTACTTGSDTHSVSITPAAASLTASPSTIDQGSSTTLTATITGTGPWNVTWSDGLQPKTGVPSPVTRTASPPRKTTYTATATNSFGCSATSNAVTVTVKPPAPTNVVAEAQSATSVAVTWSFSGTADSFEILRMDRAPGSPAGYRVVGTSTTNSFINTSVPTATACLYRVRAIVSGTPSNDSGADLATTVAFTNTAASFTMIQAADITELRSAVNAVRVLAGLTNASFTDPSLTGQFLKTVHVQELRNALDAARSSLVLPAVVYTNQPVAGGDDVMAAHVAQVRGGVR